MLPDPDELRKAADVLNEGSKMALLVGQGAAKAQQEVVEVAELLGAGVAKALLRRTMGPGTPYAIAARRRCTTRSGPASPPRACGRSSPSAPSIFPATGRNERPAAAAGHGPAAPAGHRGSVDASLSRTAHSSRRACTNAWGRLPRSWR